LAFISIDNPGSLGFPYRVVGSVKNLGEVGCGL